MWKSYLARRLYACIIRLRRAPQAKAKEQHDSSEHRGIEREDPAQGEECLDGSSQEHPDYKTGQRKGQQTP